jgi:hypothetical protein
VYNSDGNPVLKGVKVTVKSFGDRIIEMHPCILDFAIVKEKIKENRFSGKMFPHHF